MTRLGWLAIAGLVVLYALQASFVWQSRGAFAHDEVISNLAIAGHLDDWEAVRGGGPPAARWEPASTYRAFLEVDGTSFGEVRSNLTHLDLQPPLHSWSVLVARKVGLGPSSGALVVNVLAGAATILLLFHLLWWELGGLLPATAGTAVFVLSPASAYAASLSRQHVLLALAMTLLLWATCRLVSGDDRGRWWWLLGAVTAAGMLTAHHFAAPLLGALLLLGVVRARASQRGALTPLLVVGGGAGVALLVHPGATGQLRRAVDFSPGFDAVQAPDHAWTAFEGFLDVVSLEESVEIVLSPLTVVGIIVAFATRRHWLAPARDLIRRIPLVASAWWIGAAALVGYLLATTTGWNQLYPPGRQYVTAFTVPLAVAVGVLADHVRGTRWQWAGVAGACLLVAISVSGLRASHLDWGPQRRSVDAVAAATTIVADCTGRGHLTGAAMWAPPDAQVLLWTGGPVPPPPHAVDPSTTLLLHTEPTQCTRGTSVPGDHALRALGLERGARIGYIGRIEVYGVRRRAPDAAP